MIITIDGPAASGKQRIAKYISRKFNLVHLDSGILYRRIALILLNEKIKLNNVTKIKNRISKIKKISIRNSRKIRSQEISKIASKIATYQFIRKFINNLQHRFVFENEIARGFVIDGRDIGSKVFKNANLKLYVDVKADIRAKRRYKQLIDSGEKSIYQKIFKEIKLRDKKDKSRKNSPLVIPKGAKIIDNNGSFHNTITQLKRIFKSI